MRAHIPVRSRNCLLTLHIQTYEQITMYLQEKLDPWGTEEEKYSSNPNLRGTLANPLLLNLFVQAWPAFLIEVQEEQKRFVSPQVYFILLARQRIRCDRILLHRAQLGKMPIGT